ncbi:MAG: spermidine/putrescine ABC transporter substrate-binding protein [Micrococcales bacterium]|nr:spermidine/putrescine ABC transporter substrate-binding protein [Micrococcales bacterium]
MIRRVPGPVLREVAARAASAGLSRRAFLGLAGAAGGTAALTACGMPGGSSSSQLRWGNWPLYLDQSDDGRSYPSLDDFEEATGIGVQYLEDIEDNKAFFGKVRRMLDLGQDIGYDLVVLTDWMAGRWVRAGYTQEWDRTAMPNTVENLAPHLEDIPFDRGRTRTMPWQSGLTGLAWNKEKVPGGIRSIDDLWAPELAQKVVLGAEKDDTIGLVMWSQGVDPSGDWGDDEFGAAVEVVERYVKNGHVRAVRGNSYKEDLVSGDVWATVAYSGDIFQLNEESRADSDLFEFAVPEAGGLLWSDCFVVPSGADRVADVQKLIDFYYDPLVAATVAAWVNYITPVVGAQEAMADIDPELAESEAIFPTEKTLSRTAVFRTLTPEENARYDDQYLTATGG